MTLDSPDRRVPAAPDRSFAQAATNVRVITVLELRQRIRSTRWKWTALALFLLITAIVFGSLYLATLDDHTGGAYHAWTRELLTVVLGAVLFIGMIGAPAISAATINGDRRDATLAVVQATPITGTQLALGKFLGAWIATLVFFLIASPYLIWGIATAASSVGFSILAIVVTALLLGSYCAIGLGWSSLSTRPTASTMLTLATVLLLLIGLPAAFGLALPSVEQEHTVVAADRQWDRVKADADPEYQGDCVDREQRRKFTHTERIWWLLAPNPVLIVADTLAAGTPPTTYGWGLRFTDTSLARYQSTSVPAHVAHEISSVRNGPEITAARCAAPYSPHGDDYLEKDRYAGHLWYLGLAFTLILGLIGFAVAARRLRIPAGKLPKGVRVA
ncbi:ABC transporter permease [Gordonia iterans]|uniref:ABC transporter permease n=1 Tax=Gordonia iterans TaxID=1004901 RepID=A0A2S0KI91_9ACTN|nr:ABC transporter permease subunit [Gordonia iterans]AVM01383.1 ABC transporter permease [Gordonia iterans]